MSDIIELGQRNNINISDLKTKPDPNHKDRHLSKLKEIPCL